MCSNRIMIKILKSGKRLYHKFGIKHYLIFAFYMVYIVVGATIFYILEHDATEEFNRNWRLRLGANRTRFLIDRVLGNMFNNSQFLKYISSAQTQGYLHLLNEQLTMYEMEVGVRPPSPVYEWDYLNAILYSCNVVTTIGYGHLFPMTNAGKVATMIFSMFGMPLTLLVLRDLVGLLTKLLNYPGLLLARCWDVFRFCTLQAIDEDALRVKRQLRSGKLSEINQRSIMMETMLHIPTIVAVFALIGWLFAGAFLFCLWEKDWTVLTAFYFCFNSVSTIGTSDPVPSEPKILLLLFFYIFIGLAVVSLFINLIHVKVSRAYWMELAARHEFGNRWKINNNEPEATKAFVESFADEETASDLDLGSCVTLGILQMQERRPLLEHASYNVHRVTKMTQTNVTLPTKRTVQIEQTLANGHRVVTEHPGGYVYHGSRSMDDVQRLLTEVYD